MRVTSNSFSDSLINHLQKQTRRQSTLQTQIASGQRIQDASDDPLGASRVLMLRDDSVAGAQFQKNIETHQDFSTVTHSALQSLQKILNRVQEIALSADDIDSSGDLSSYGKEVGELLKQAVDLGNTTFRGEYIFAGTKSNAAALKATFDENSRVQGVEFVGSTAEAPSEIAPGIAVSSRLPAMNMSGSGEVGVFGDSRSGADIFSHVVALQNQLLSGDTAGVRATGEDLQKDEENLLYHVAGNGALQARLEAMLNTNKDQKLARESDISKNVDTDISEAVVRLSQQQTAYQATLQSAASVMNLSLLSYLR